VLAGANWLRAGARTTQHDAGVNEDDLAAPFTEEWQEALCDTVRKAHVRVGIAGQVFRSANRRWRRARSFPRVDKEIDTTELTFSLVGKPFHS
jgi:hypothetical protein